MLYFISELSYQNAAELNKLYKCIYMYIYNIFKWSDKEYIQ